MCLSGYVSECRSDQRNKSFLLICFHNFQSVRRGRPSVNIGHDGTHVKVCYVVVAQCNDVLSVCMIKTRLCT